MKSKTFEVDCLDACGFVEYFCKGNEFFVTCYSVECLPGVEVDIEQVMKYKFGNDIVLNVLEGANIWE